MVVTNSCTKITGTYFKEIFREFLKRLRHGYIFRKYSNNINISEILLLCIAPEIL